MDEPINLSSLAKYFSDEDAARELLEQWRWPNGVACPHCGGTDPYKLISRATSKRPGRKGLYKCRSCYRQFTVTVKTVFEDCRMPLSKVLLAIHLIASSKKGISAHQIHRNLQISYKAAWFLLHRLRYAMSEGPLAELLKGTIEMDETYVGGRKRGSGSGRPGKKSPHKTPVVALVQRGGKVRAFPVARVTAKNLRKALRDNVHESAHLMTDEFMSYRNIGQEKHSTVNHGRGEYVRGEAHTNSAEGFFSLLKRGINGVYHHVGKGHLHRYCDEFAFRHNHRAALGVNDGQRAKALMRGAEGKRLTYAQPVTS